MKDIRSNKELWQTAYDWLLLSGNKINKSYCKDEITSHPEYPSLISVIDFLDSGAMGYKAVKSDASYIHEFNYPVLAHIRKPGQEYMHLVNASTDWDSQKSITQHWTGIVVYPQKNAQWNNEQNYTYQSNEVKNKIIAAALVLTGAILFFISSFQFPDTSINIFGFLSLIGLIISILLLGTELGFQNQAIKQVCGAVSNGGCERVLNSSYAKGIAGITPADASILYFGAQFIVYSLGCWYTSVFAGILLLSVPGIVIAGWSIYIQAVKLKQWCALCLGIVVILVLQSISALFVLQNYLLNSGTIATGLGVFILLFFILALALFPIKQLIKVNNNYKLKLVELKKWKSDADLFMNQWQQEQEVAISAWDNDLVIGDSSAPLLITVACNPYCNPCAKAHKQLDNLLHRFPGKLKVQLRLLCNYGDENDRRTRAVTAILKKAEKLKKADELQQMLTDWFNWMDFEKWETIWQPCNTIDVTEKLQLHHQWIESNAIAFTPTFFINGKKIPGRYSLDDIEILIPQLAEQIIA